VSTKPWELHNEANLPVGDEIERSIAQLLDSRFGNGHDQRSDDRLIMESIRKIASAGGGRDANPMLHDCRHISKARSQAILIDNLIESHRADQQIAVLGKLTIAKAILDAEARSLMLQGL